RDRGAPIGPGEDEAAPDHCQEALGDDMAPLAGASVETRLMQPECELDDVGDTVGHAFALLILEGVQIAADSQESRLQMLGADNAETGWIDRLAAPLHCREKLGDAAAVDL